MPRKSETETADYITTALLLLMEKKAFSRITVTEVCEKAGVSRMSFYRCFPSRLDILRRKCAAITDEFLQRSGLSFQRDPLQQYLITLFTHLYQHRDLIELLRRSDLLYIIKDDITRVFLSLYENVYGEYKARFISGGLFDVFCLWVQNGFRETPEELALQLRHMLEQ
ncbi:MAG: TetR/AcrR family transcriptional regulator [Oscillospiraceae bacterium]|nr:TetR/AcrR family transcriptional regulator [Oscillospiraceae bacterium]